MRSSLALAFLLLSTIAACTADDSPTPPGGGCPDLDEPGACFGNDACVTDFDSPAYDGCGGAIYECVDGAWVTSGWCDKFPLAVTGTVGLDQYVAELGPGCPALAVPAQVDVSATPDDVFTSADLAISGVEVLHNRFDVDITFVGAATWDGLDVTITYHLRADHFGVVTGTADLVAGDCAASLTVTGTATIAAI